jgi:hypothetical protein|nr:hypothetical protein [Kofleriaceae bacterium]
MARRMFRPVVVAAMGIAGCSNLLGLSAPREGTDAPPPIDAAAVDAAPPVTVHVVTGGTAAPSRVQSEPAGIDCPGTCDATFAPGATIELSATGGGGVFTGFFGGGCTGSGARDCTLIAPGGDVTVFARDFDPQANLVFVTSTQQPPGGFNSRGAADALCDTLAGSAGLPTGSDAYVAYLSASDTTADARIIAQGRGEFTPSDFVRPDGALVFAASPDVTAGNIVSPIRLDEFGRDVGDDAVVVTNTNADGTATTGNACQLFSSTSDATPLTAGFASGGVGQFTSDAPAVACSAPARLYCVGGRNRGNPPARAPLAQTVLFVTTGTISGGQGIGAADDLCHSEAVAASLPNPSTLALITPGAGQAVAARFQLDVFESAPQRPDGVQLAPSMTALLGSGFDYPVPPDVAADGTPVDATVWIGAGDYASVVTDCSGWTSSSSSQFGVTRPAATTRASTFFQQQACDQVEHVLCLNFIAGVLPGLR